MPAESRSNVVTAIPQPTLPIRLRIGSADTTIAKTLARAVGRADCPVDWYGYAAETSRLSLCYGPDWTLDVSTELPENHESYDLLNGTIGTTGVSAGSPQGHEWYNLSNETTGEFVGFSSITLPPPGDSGASLVRAFCDALSKSSGIPQSSGEIGVDDLTGSYCRSHYDGASGGMNSIFGILSVPGGKHLQFDLYSRSSDATINDEIAAILRTIVVR